MSGVCRLALLVAAISLCLGQLVSAADMEPRLTPAEAVAAVDWNKDGAVDRREFFDAMVYDHFVLDIDRDGFISFKELEIYQVERSEFDAADADGDGRLGLYEYVNARFEDFEIADENRDGLLSLNEVTRFEHQLY
jgi:Ca2+-binding EF-hand superfamily protein